MNPCPGAWRPSADKFGRAYQSVAACHEWVAARMPAGRRSELHPQMSTASSPMAALPAAKHRRRVIVGAALGTAFEWYDFFLYGSLAAVISRQFFAGVSGTTAFIFALLTFAVGFAVRPFGAL